MHKEIRKGWRNTQKVGKITINLFLCLAVLGGLAFFSNVPARSESGNGSPQAAYKLFLPVTRKGMANSQPILLGIYSQGWPGDQNTMDNEFHSLDSWAGKRLSIAGTFISFVDPNYPHDVTDQLNMMWNNGYTPFVNIDVGTLKLSAYDIAVGKIDGNIHSWARAFALYANGGQRMAFLAPLQEMNGDWVSYGLTPVNFKLAYAHIQQIFNEEGVPRKSVRWTFAPNGWSDPKNPPFEDYYPGDGSVDVVAFSAYNFGFTISGGIWEDPESVFPKYIRRMTAMAPSKPLFISQTATSAYKARGDYNVSEKNRWLREAYPYLAGFSSVRAVIYFNLENWQKVDWPFYVYNDSAKKFTGFREGVADSRFGYLSPGQLINTDLTPR
jgi:hypothetical protein